MKNFRNLHLFVSGGEPLLAQEEMSFLIAEALEKGHSISVDTNLSMPRKILEEFFTVENRHIWKFINISHHLHSEVNDDLLVENTLFLQRLGIPLFVKYIAVPDDMDRVESWLAFWHDIRIGASTTIFYGPWKGRSFPGDYTRHEVGRILPLMGLVTHALQLLGGINLCGLPCRGGSSFLSWNQTGLGKIIPCCHGGGYDVAWESTQFAGGGSDLAPCQVDAPCSGDLMFLYGFQGCFDEVERFDALCRGNFTPVTLDELFEAATAIMTATGREFAGWKRFTSKIPVERELRVGVDQQREKWRELPNTRQGRLFSSDLLAMSDEDLLSHWEECRASTSTSEHRQWYQTKYQPMLQGKKVLEIGPGVGIDGFYFARNGAEKVVFADIVEDNLSVLRRLSDLLDIKNVDFYYIDDFQKFHFSDTFDVMMGIGSLHHMPFEFMQKEIAAISPFIKDGGMALMLAYPYGRYLYVKARNEAEFGRMTDGERTPWAEWYDESKVEKLFGPDYHVRWWRNFGMKNREFNWFEIEKGQRKVPE